MRCMFVGRFIFKAHHIAGKDNVVADAFTRQFAQRQIQTLKLEISSLEEAQQWDPEVKAIASAHSRAFAKQDGLLYKLARQGGKVVVLPSVFRPAAMREAHSGHTESTRPS